MTPRAWESRWPASTRMSVAAGVTSAFAFFALSIAAAILAG